MVRRLAIFVVLALAVAVLRGEEPPAAPRLKAPPGAPADSKASQPAPKEPEDEYELQRVLVDALDQIERNYVKPIQRRELIEAAIEGALRKLDPYSSYIGPKELDQFRTSVESEFGGIGIQVSLEEGQLLVLSPLVGTPAYEAGILAGDAILEIDGQPTEDLDLDEAVRRLKGPSGSKVVLTVLHAHQSEPRKIELVRRQIHVETVLGDRRKADGSWDFLLDRTKRIGYVRLGAFSRQTADDLRKVLQSLRQEKLAGLVLDLRFNPGGLLSSAIEVSDLFVSGGRIVSTSGRNVPEQTWDAHPEGTFEGFPMVVLVNRFTASAGEIVAACLQDHKRAVVMGERTWGKGSVQNVISLEDGRSALKLTTAAYRRPSGKNIHRFPDATDEDEWGVTPNEPYRLELEDDELLALIQQRRQGDVVPAKPTPNTAPAKPIDAKPADAKPADAKPADAKPQSSGPAKPAGAPSRPDGPAVTDRLRKMAVEYLDRELAKAR